MKTVIKTGLAALCVSAGTAWSAPITFNTALPVHEGGYVLREQFVFMKNADDQTPARRDLEVTGLVSVLGYGVTRDFALFGTLPYFDKDLDLKMGGGSINRGKHGFGDLILLGRETLFEHNAPGQTLRVAPFLGVKAPTGSDNARDRLGRLPPPVQPSSGSWDLLGGAVLTYQTLDFQIDSQVSYKANREANDFEFGDVFEADASLQYRLWPRKLGSGVPAFLYGVLEANLVHADKNRLSGTTDQNSGGTTLFLSPGIQYVTKKWIVEAGVQVPVVQNLHGTALENDYVATAGFRINF